MENLKLDQTQKSELGKVALDAGKITFLGTSAAYFLPSLAQTSVSLTVFFGGLFLSLIFLFAGIILLGRENMK